MKQYFEFHEIFINIIIQRITRIGFSNKVMNFTEMGYDIRGVMFQGRDQSVTRSFKREL